MNLIIEKKYIDVEDNPAKNIYLKETLTIQVLLFLSSWYITK